MNSDSSKKRILDKIKDVKMKPKIVFVFKALGFAIIVSLLTVCAVFLISFVFYANHFPWILVLIIVIILLLIEILMYKFKFNYHRPLIYSIILVLFITIIVGFMLHKTSFHERVSCFCDKNSIPIFDELYKKYNNTDLKGCGCGTCNHFFQKLK